MSGVLKILCNYDISILNPFSIPKPNIPVWNTSIPASVYVVLVLNNPPGMLKDIWNVVKLFKYYTFLPESLYLAFCKTHVKLWSL